MRKGDPRLVPSRAAKASEFAVLAHQLTAAMQPGSSIRALVGADAALFAGRPYSVWRDDPEIARAVNDSLAKPPKG